MPTKKRKKTSKRKNRTLSSGGKRKSPRRRRAKKGMLSEIGLADGNSPSFGQTLKKTVGAGIGGGVALGMHKLLPANVGKLWRLLGSTVISGVLIYAGMPSTGGGLMGGTIALNFQNGFLNDDANYVDENALADAPVYLDENGQAMVLEEGEDGTSGYRYLSNAEVQYLSEQGAFAEYELVS